MLQIVYIVAFTVLSLLAVTNLIRSMISLAQNEAKSQNSYANRANRTKAISSRTGQFIHPELLDASGNIIDEPLLVIRSMGVEDARLRLDALYESSPGSES